MITLRPSTARGHAHHGWLDSHHTFSFANYYDPDHMGFRALRVINEDWIAPGRGFGTHSHRDMEIVTYVLEGALEHRDSLGTGAIIRPGEVQRMTAGSGIAHSEFNASATDPVHLLQIWLLPDTASLPPSYEQRAFPIQDQPNQLHPVAANHALGEAVQIHQDVTLLAGRLNPGQSLTHELALGRHGWLQVARGSLTLNDHLLETGDGAAISDETLLRFSGVTEAEILFFDLA